MRLIVGWYNPKTSQLVDIPGFDHVGDPGNWVPAVVEIEAMDVWERKVLAEPGAPERVDEIEGELRAAHEPIYGFDGEPYEGYPDD